MTAAASLDDQAYRQALYASASIYVGQHVAVIPLGPVSYDADGKKSIKPLIKWQREPHTLVRDQPGVERWFGPLGAARGLAIATGPSGLLALDLDEYKAGFAGIALPAGAWFERGGRGGGHAYLRNPTGASNTAGSVATGVDARGTGGLIIASPTRCLFADGTVTQWTPELPLGQLDTAALPDAPAELISHRSGARALGIIGEPTEMTTARAAAAVDGGRQRWLTSVKGGRHAALLDYLGSITRYLMAQGRPVHEVAADLETAALEHPDAVAGEEFGDDVPAAIAWAVDTARREPWVLVEPTPFEARFSPGPLHPAEHRGALPTLSREFWESRAVLTHIRDAAWSKRLSPDAVLHAVLARLSAGRRATLGVDSGIEVSSLNYFAAVVGPSGSGKSRAWKLAARLLALDPDDCPVKPLGSGEGVSEAFMGSVSQPDPDNGLKMVRVRQQIRHNVLFELDEGQTLTAMLSRTGATIGPVLRTAWSGGVLGQANADAERNRRVEGYAAGLVVGFQPEALETLIGDVHTGMPQRFAFVPAVDPTLPRVRPDFPGELPGDRSAVLRGQVANPFEVSVATAGVVTVPAAVTDELDAVLHAVGSGEVTPPELDSQRVAMLLRMAGLVALLEGRFDVSASDWELAGALWASSAAVRDALVARNADTAERSRDLADERYANRQARAAAAVDGVPKAVDRVATRIARSVHAGEYTTRGEAKRHTAQRDRHLLAAAYAYAEGQAWLHVGDRSILPGASQPAPPA